MWYCRAYISIKSLDKEFSQEMKIAVVGASGIVGQEMLSILSRYQVQLFPIGLRSAGKWITIGSHKQPIADFETFDFRQVDGVVVSAGSQCAKSLKSRIGSAWLIDNSAAFRQLSDVSLVVPEIFNGEPSQVVASPNCVAIPISLVLYPILQLTNIIEVWGSTYQSVSGAGRNSMALLDQQRGIYDNIQSGIGEIGGDGVSDEEVKIAQEVQKILSIQCLVEVMSVRVPIRYGHSVHLRVVLEKKIQLETVLEKLKGCPYIKLYDISIPEPVQARGSHQVHVGRVRQRSNVLDLWVVSDNVYRGAAWNVCQIAKQYFGLKEVAANG